MDGETRIKPKPGMSFVGKGAKLPKVEATVVYADNTPPPFVAPACTSVPHYPAAPTDVSDAIKDLTRAIEENIRAFSKLNIEIPDPYITINVPPNPVPSVVLHPDVKLQPYVVTNLIVPIQAYYLFAAVAAVNAGFGAFLLWRFW